MLTLMVLETVKLQYQFIKLVAAGSIQDILKLIQVSYWKQFKFTKPKTIKLKIENI